jgi:hypothetical protein
MINGAAFSLGALPLASSKCVDFFGVAPFPKSFAGSLINRVDFQSWVEHEEL